MPILVDASRFDSPSRAHVVLACDEAYAMPLATALLSLAETHRELWPIHATVLTPGLAEPTMERVESSLPESAITLRWATIDTRPFQSFSVLSHVSSTTFARLVLPQVLGPEVGRVLYLDADMLILDSLVPVMSTDLGGCPIGAVPDLHVDADASNGAGGGPSGIPKVASYFNAGMLLIDLDACRRQRIFERAIDYLVEHPDTPYGDQDALNVACDGAWMSLDTRWNFQAHRQYRIGRMASAERPAIVHFISSAKPWKPSSASINAALYNTYRDRTRFRRSLWERARATLCTLSHRVRNRVTRAELGRRVPFWT